MCGLHAAVFGWLNVVRRTYRNINWLFVSVNEAKGKARCTVWVRNPSFHDRYDGQASRWRKAQETAIVCRLGLCLEAKDCGKGKG